VAGYGADQVFAARSLDARLHGVSGGRIAASHGDCLFSDMRCAIL
jgi:hypothetical protein